MDIDDITTISLEMALGNINLFNLQKKYEEQFEIIKFINSSSIGCRQSIVNRNFKLPSLLQLFTNFNDKCYEFDKNKVIKFGRFKSKINDIILFGKIEIPFENEERIDIRFPCCFIEDESLALLDENGLIIKGIYLHEK